MKKYEVWEEGYSVTGNSDEARLIGTVEANSFQEACDYLCFARDYYDSKNLSIWGCRLFDNEADARKSFR